MTEPSAAPAGDEVFIPDPSHAVDDEHAAMSEGGHLDGLRDPWFDQPEAQQGTDGAVQE